MYLVSLQVTPSTSQGTLAAISYLTALRDNPTAALTGLSYMGDFSLEYNSTQILVAAPAGNAVQATLVFTLAFAAQPSQTDAAVQSAVQTAVASANTSVTATTSAVDVGSGVYNVTVALPLNDQVPSALSYTAMCLDIFVVCTDVL